MKRLLIIAMILSITLGVFAQDIPFEGVGAPDPTRIGMDAAQLYLKEVSVDKFEHEGYWRAIMGADLGTATARLFEGGPMGKEMLADEVGRNIPDNYVLGVRVDFQRRTHGSVVIAPRHPIPIEGITKTPQLQP